MSSNWYSRQLERIADVHGSILARSPQQMKGLVMRCVGVSISDEVAEKIASVAKKACEESEVVAVLREDAKLPLAAANALARSIMPGG